MKVTWDGVTHIGTIIEPPNVDGVIQLDVRVDVWSSAVVDWENSLLLRRHYFPLTYSGGAIDPVTGDQQGALFTLNAPWKLQLYDATHELRLKGVLRTSDGSRFWIPPPTADGYAVIADPPNDVVSILPDDETLLLIAKILRNRRETDPTVGKQRIYDDDSVTVLLEGDIYEDVAGTTPYDGTSVGIDRADRLE